MNETVLMTREDVEAFMQIKDRAARKLMHRVGCLEMCGRIYVRRDSLLAYIGKEFHAPQSDAPDRAPRARRTSPRKSIDRDSRYLIPRRKSNGA